MAPIKTPLLTVDIIIRYQKGIVLDRTEESAIWMGIAGRIC